MAVGEDLPMDLNWNHLARLDSNSFVFRVASGHFAVKCIAFTAQVNAEGTLSSVGN